MFNPRIAAVTLLVALIPVAASAGEVQHRIGNQNARIDQGVHSGSLTNGEYHRLDNSATRIQAARNRDLRNGSGHLTTAQYRNLNRRENVLSDRIFFDKHDTARQH